MTTDEIAAVLEAKISPLRREIRRLASEVEAVRRALPQRPVTAGEATEADPSRMWCDDLEEGSGE